MTATRGVDRDRPRRAMRAGAGLILLAYVLLALWPFRWNDLPRLLANGAAVDDPDMIAFPAEGLVRTAKAPPWVREAMRTDEFEVRLRVRPASPEQSGPARILTVSADSGRRNLTVGQENGDLDIRLRTPATSLNGMPSYVIPSVFSRSSWTEIAILVRSSRISVRVDGDTLLTEAIPQRSLAAWDPRYRLALGNELTGDRPWLGEISDAIVRVGDRNFEYLGDDSLVVPPWYWTNLNLRPFWTVSFRGVDPYTPLDGLLNLVCFVPFGFLLGASVRSRGWRVVAVAGTMFVVLAVEIAQLSLDTRHSSVLDWVLNSFGTITGVCIGSRYRRVVR
jgi:VanZ like family/Concanavalin A-like lectin/glucanases superfamily